MKNYFNSINGRLTLSLSIFSLIIFILFSVLYNQISNIDKYSDYHTKTELLSKELLKLIEIDNQFARYEKYESNFFDKKNESRYNKRKRIITEINEGVFELFDILSNGNPSIVKKANLDTLSKTINSYNICVGNLIALSKQRGFKDYGLEGEMRSTAHNLENNGFIPRERLLSLRRHEKDYFLRSDTLYVSKFIHELNRINNKTKSDTAKKLLKLYLESFLNIVQVEKSIGLNTELGLRDQINVLENKLKTFSTNVQESSSKEIAILVSNSKIIFLISSIITLVLSLLLITILTRHFAAPITKLTNAVAQNKTKDLSPSINSISSLNEIKFLSQAFENKQRLITDKVKELKRKNRVLNKVNSELDMFVYSTAHDLKAPLASLLGLIKVLRLEPLTKQNLETYLTMMDKSIYKLNDFIIDIIYYSKNNRTKIILEKIDFNNIIDNILIHYQYIPNASKVEIIKQIDNSIILKSDKVRIEAILRNLVSNAIRYADLTKKSPKVWISIYKFQNKIILEVKDNGIGIEKEYQEKIFTMFYRASEQSTGSGLGLFIVKEMTKKIRGKCQFESTHGEGTSIRIAIPNREPKRNTQKIEPKDESHELLPVSSN